MSSPTIIWPAQRPTPLSELPTGKDGLLQRDHCPHKVIKNVSINKITRIINPLVIKIKLKNKLDLVFMRGVEGWCKLGKFLK